MSWWKTAIIQNNDDRNDANFRIKKLIAMAELLRYAAKLVFQTARGARYLAADVAGNQTLSSFPEALKLLEEADLLALDSPRKFGELCKAAAQVLEMKAVDLEDDRHDFAEGRHKGIVDE